VDKVAWGVLSTAKIGLQKVIPAMQKGRHSRIVAIASRDMARARDAAVRLRIPKAHGSYEALLGDPDIQAVYIPLPNHLHVEWSIKALETGKHVLCEKPIGLDAEQSRELRAAADRYPRLKVMEAFMYRFHPQWIETRNLVADGRLGELRSIQTFFSYYNIDPANVRNKPDLGGGGMLDIGCYCVSLSRFLFDDEPRRVFGVVEYDRKFKTDRLASGILEFEAGTSTFTCSTQLSAFQRVNVIGTAGRIEIEIPFNAPPRKRCRIWHQSTSRVRQIRLPKCDQYTIQGDLFSQAVLNDTDVPTPLDDAVANMRVIDAVFASGRTGTWQTL
jgi:predicted dehydrogenase